MITGKELLDCYAEGNNMGSLPLNRVWVDLFGKMAEVFNKRYENYFVEKQLLKSPEEMFQLALNIFPADQLQRLYDLLNKSGCRINR